VNADDGHRGVEYYRERSEEVLHEELEEGVLEELSMLPDVILYI